MDQFPSWATGKIVTNKTCFIDVERNAAKLKSNLLNHHPSQQDIDPMLKNRSPPPLPGKNKVDRQQSMRAL